MAFDLDEIATKILNRDYRVLGSGSGRHVFDLDNGYVAKAARNMKGIVQNKVEYEISADDHSGLFAEVLQVSDGYDLLIMEKAQRVRNIGEVWDYFHVRDNYELSDVDALRRVCELYELLFEDLVRASSWGRIEQRVVLIDYGFTLSVRRMYYRLF